MLPVPSTDGARGGDLEWEEGGGRPTRLGRGHLVFRDFEAGFDVFRGAEPPVDLDFEVFPAGFLAVGLEGVVFLELLPSPVSRRCRRAASTRFPTPRPSRASWVGVEVDPEIFFSGGSGADSDFLLSEGDSAFDSVDSVDSVAVESPPAVESESLAACWSLASASDPDDPDDLEEPPTRMAAPMPINRRSLRFRHSGQVFSCFAVID